MRQKEKNIAEVTKIMTNYILEVGTEEIPASFIAPALEDMLAKAKKALDEKHIDVKNIKTFGTPRRLTLILEGLAEKGEDLTEELRGPAKKAAYDAEGNPTKALLGFAKAQGVDLANVVVKELNGNEYVFATKHTSGIDTKPFIASFMPNLITSVNFPKTMRWGSLDFHFPRPIRWIVSLWDKEVLPITIADITAGNVSRGHRFLGSDHVVISCADNYEEELKKEFVIVDPEKRKEEIIAGINNIAKVNNCNIALDEELIEEVMYLVEWPTALMGKFTEDYLNIPEEVVITPMREHQRYFPVRDNNGKLLNRFVTVRNGGDRSLDLVAKGNENVLAARLADARFFWDEDRKQPLENYLPKLDKVTFQEKLGTIGAKIKRDENLVEYLADVAELSPEDKKTALRGMHLAKADLVTSMVFEFTELQGIMGRYYALECGETKEVAEVIFEHYLPRFAGEDTASSVAGAIAAIADKMDTIAGIYCAGLEPTGSQDPYALRRAAMGICLTMMNQKLDFDLNALIKKALDQFEYVVPEKEKRAEIENKIKDFFGARIKNIMIETNHKYDVVDCAMGTNYSRISEVAERCLALSSMRDNESFKKLAAVYTRANNLAKKGASWVIDPSLLKEEVEKTLYNEINQTKNVLEEVVKKDGLKATIIPLSKLADPINNFFEGVMVMDKDENIKANRLALLANVVALTEKIGDLSKLQD